MRVLVIGGAGFIGSHFAALLAKKDIDFCVYDSLVSGKKERIPEGIPFIQGDIRDENALSKAMRGITHVVHLAALVSVAESVTDPIATHEVNVSGTENVLNTMRTLGIMHFVYASSAAVYGDEPSIPKHESSPLQPQSPYALSKAINEMQAQMYERVFGLSTTGLRFFNVYGPGQAGNHPYASVIPRWIEAVLAGKGITVYGDGSQTRDFVHVRDVAGALYQALIKEKPGIFNVASGEEISLNNLLKIIAEIQPHSFEVKKESPRKGDILRSVADISVARRVLDFEPSIKLPEGIEELFALHNPTTCSI